LAGSNTTDAQSCAVPVCERDSEHGGYCGGHYERKRKTGDAGTTPVRSLRKRGSVRARCKAPSCSQVEESAGYCLPHYSRVHRNGMPGTKPLRSKTSANDLADGQRSCAICAESKPLAQYAVAKSCVAGRRATCKDCNKARDRIRLEEFPDAVRSSMAAGNARRRTRFLGIEIDPRVTTRSLRDMYGDSCAYCSVTMSFDTPPRGTYWPKKASIDHVVPIASRGNHTFDNTVLACLRCNISKRDTPLSVWMQRREP
jgi:hypothetical protein